jgi:hypothetical protein
LKEYLDDQSKPTVDQNSPTPTKKTDLKIPGITDGERTYSAFLPKADLNQIISTAITQQSQTGKNFGVVTINPGFYTLSLNCHEIITSTSIAV